MGFGCCGSQHALAGDDTTKTWAGTRHRALCRSVVAVILAFWATLLPLLQHPGLVAVCNTYMEMAQESLEEQDYTNVDHNDMRGGTIVTFFTAVMSLTCLGLVLNSQMKWWLTSSFLVYLRWHVLLNAVNVWLFHFLAAHRWCAVQTTLIELTIFTWVTVICHVFFWCNKFMGFVVIKSHLETLESEFKQNLGSRVLDYLLMLFGVSLLSATVLLVSFVVVAGKYRLLILGVAFIEACIVVSTLLVAGLMTRGFYLAYRAARREEQAAQRPAERELASKAVHFSKRLVWETPFNLTMVATAFAFHSAWLSLLDVHEGHSARSMSLELGFLVMATLSLTNCARFGQLLSLVEYEKPVQTQRTTSHLSDLKRDLRKSVSRLMQNATGTENSLEDPPWSTGHEQWDAVTHDLACRGITLGRLLHFYSKLQEKMEHFDPNLHTTADVVRQVIIPMSRDSPYGDCPAAKVLMEGQAVLPDRMVTHGWSNKFSNLVAAVVADALDLPSYACVLSRLRPGEMTALKSELFGKRKLALTYWICCFAVNQHASICGNVPERDKDPVTGEVPEPCSCSHPKYWSKTPPLKDGQGVFCEMNKFDDMMALISTLKPGFAQVIAVDVEFKLFTRAWCVAEIHQAQQIGTPQRMRIMSEGSLGQYEGWLHSLKVEEMEASNPEDKELILSKIADKGRFNSELQSLIFGKDGLVSASKMGFERVALLGIMMQRDAVRLQGFSRDSASASTSASSLEVRSG